MDEQELHSLIEREAFTIWQRRDREGRMGNREQDWHDAEKVIEIRLRAEIVGISPHNRLERYF